MPKVMTRRAEWSCTGMLTWLMCIPGAASAQSPPTQSPQSAPALGAALQGEPLTVEQAVQEAVAKNLGLRAQASQIQVAEGQVRQAAARPNPVVTSTLISGRLAANPGEHTWSTSIDQELETAGKRRDRTRVASADLARIRHETDTFQRDLIVRTQQAYFSLVLAQRDVILARESSAIVQRFVDLNTERVRVGETPGLELNVAKVELARSQRNVQEFERRLRAATGTLNLLTGRPLAASVLATGDFSPPAIALPPDSELVDSALTTRPEVLAAESAVAARSAAVNLARAFRIPNVTLSVGYQQARSVFGRSNLFGAGISATGALVDVDRLLVFQGTLPLPVFNRNTGSISSAEYERRAAEAAAQYARQVVEHEVRVALTNYRSRVTTRAAYEASVLPLLQRNVDAIQEAYRLGNESIFAVIQVQRTLFDTRQEYLQTLFDLELDRIDLERATGRPVR